MTGTPTAAPDLTPVVVRAPRLVYVVGTYPSLTTTFIDREIALLRDEGVAVQVISLRDPERVSPTQRRLREDVRHVLPIPPRQLLASHARTATRHPIAYLGTLAYLLSRRHRSLQARVKTLLHFGVAVQVAELVRRGPEVDHIHAHFVDRATTVALVVSRLLGLPYSATAHANDIYVDPVLLPQKLAGASFVATCTGYNAEHLATVSETAASKVVCIHHGLDPHAYQPGRDADRAGVPLILAVAQLRPKKGLVHLIDACARLRDAGHTFSCVIVGEGPLRRELEERIQERGVGDLIELVGALEHPAVVAWYRRASLFVLPCVTAPDGDRDGIPNVILEAMAMELPVVSTWHSGIPEAVEDGRSGVLVEPQDPGALADAIGRLLEDADLRCRLGQRGRQIVVASFDIKDNARRLLQRFDTTGVPR
jgi:colanic acid/amylovoran biosynthesis glycosyltransferase